MIDTVLINLHYFGEVTAIDCLEKGERKNGNHPEYCCNPAFPIHQVENDHRL